MLKFKVCESVFETDLKTILGSSLVDKGSLITVIASSHEEDMSEVIEIKHETDPRHFQAILDSYKTKWINVLKQYHGKIKEEKKTEALYGKMIGYYGIIKITKPLTDIMPTLGRLRYEYLTRHPIIPLTNTFVYGINVLCDFIGVPRISNDFYLPLHKYKGDDNLVDVLCKKIIKCKNHHYHTETKDGKLKIYSTPMPQDLTNIYTIDVKSKTITDDYSGDVYHVVPYVNMQKIISEYTLSNCVAYAFHQYYCINVDMIVSRRSPYLIFDFVDNPDAECLVDLGYLPELPT